MINTRQIEIDERVSIINQFHGEHPEVAGSDDIHEITVTIDKVEWKWVLEFSAKSTFKDKVPRTFQYVFNGEKRSIDTIVWKADD